MFIKTLMSPTTELVQLTQIMPSLLTREVLSSNPKMLSQTHHILTKLISLLKLTQEVLLPEELFH